MTPDLMARRALLRLKKQFVDWTGRSGQVYFIHRVAEYRDMWRAVCDAEGAGFTVLADDVWQIDLDGVTTRIYNHQMEFDNPVVLGLAGKKAAVHRLLQCGGLAVPDHALFTLSDLETAYRFMDGHPRGCVIKPANGYGGMGVTTHVQSRAEVKRAALLASLYGHELLIEVMIPGESYRLLVLDGSLVHAVRRTGPRLTGDGGATVRQLIDADNARRIAAGEHALDIDRDCLFTLEYQGLTPDSIVAPGREVLVKSVNDPARKYVEVRTVYSETVTRLICESVRRDAEAAARLVGSDFLGVDIITTDPTVPLRQSGGTINEVNTTPALHHHYEDPSDPYPAVAALALKAVLRKKGATVPVAAR